MNAVTLGAQPLEVQIEALRAAGVRFNRYADALLANHVQVAATEHTVHVEVHTVHELGWPDGALIGDLLAAAGARGLGPCTLEVALQLRLAWREHRVWPRITVASGRFDPDEHVPRGFYLRDYAEGSWLRGYVASDDWRYTPDERFALLRR